MLKLIRKYLHFLFTEINISRLSSLSVLTIEKDLSASGCAALVSSALVINPLESGD